MTETERNAGQVVKGGSLVLISSLLAGTIGWIWGVLASRSDIGFGAAGYGIVSMANSIIIFAFIVLANFLQAKFEEKYDVGKKYANAYQEYRQKTGMFGPLLLWIIIIVVITLILTKGIFI